MKDGCKICYHRTVFAVPIKQNISIVVLPINFTLQLNTQQISSNW